MNNKRKVFQKLNNKTWETTFIQFCAAVEPLLIRKQTEIREENIFRRRRMKTIPYE